MKKYIFRYVFIIVLIIILFLTKESQPKLIIGEFNDYLETGITEGFYGTYQVLVTNICFGLILSIATVSTTMSKENKVKFKYLIATGIILVMFFFLPFMKQTYFGGTNYAKSEKYYSGFSYITHIFR